MECDWILHIGNHWVLHSDGFGMVIVLLESYSLMDQLRGNERKQPGSTGRRAPSSAEWSQQHIRSEA